MRAPNKDRAAIEAEWHGCLTCARVAKKYSLTKRHIERIWNAARVAGRLPPGDRRDHELSLVGLNGAAVASPALAVLLEAAGAPSERDIAMSAAALYRPGFELPGGERCIPARDPLLIALLRAHRGDRRRAGDDTLVSDRQFATPATLVARLARVRDLETRGAAHGR